MQIGQLSAASGLSRDTLRFYERLGLLRAQRRANGYRDYAASQIGWLAQIKLAQQLGFTLSEITAAMPLLGERPRRVDDAVAQMLASKLSEVNERLARMVALRNELVARIAAQCPLHQSAA